MCLIVLSVQCVNVCYDFDLGFGLYLCSVPCLLLCCVCFGVVNLFHDMCVFVVCVVLCCVSVMCVNVGFVSNCWMLMCLFLLVFAYMFV